MYKSIIFSKLYQLTKKMSIKTTLDVYIYKVIMLMLKYLSRFSLEFRDAHQQ
jgi:hypothetical protein